MAEGSGERFAKSSSNGAAGAVREPSHVELRTSNCLAARPRSGGLYGTGV